MLGFSQRGFSKNDFGVPDENFYPSSRVRNVPKAGPKVTKNTRRPLPATSTSESRTSPVAVVSTEKYYSPQPMKSTVKKEHMFKTIPTGPPPDYFDKVSYTPFTERPHDASHRPYPTRTRSTKGIHAYPEGPSWTEPPEETPVTFKKMILDLCPCPTCTEEKGQKCRCSAKDHCSDKDCFENNPEATPMPGRELTTVVIDVCPCGKCDGLCKCVPHPGFPLPKNCVRNQPKKSGPMLDKCPCYQCTPNCHCEKENATVCTDDRCWEFNPFDITKKYPEGELTTISYDDLSCNDPKVIDKCPCHKCGKNCECQDQEVPCDDEDCWEFNPFGVTKVDYGGLKTVIYPPIQFGGAGKHDELDDKDDTSELPLNYMNTKKIIKITRNTPHLPWLTKQTPPVSQNLWGKSTDDDEDYVNKKRRRRDTSYGKTTEPATPGTIFSEEIRNEEERIGFKTLEDLLEQEETNGGSFNAQDIETTTAIDIDELHEKFEWRNILDHTAAVASVEEFLMALERIDFQQNYKTNISLRPSNTKIALKQDSKHCILREENGSILNYMSNGQLVNELDKTAKRCSGSSKQDLIRITGTSSPKSIQLYTSRIMSSFDTDNPERKNYPYSYTSRKF